MPSVRLVIGYGNPLRADDGFGWVVAQRLRERLNGDDPFGDVVVLAEHQLTPELAEPVSRTRLVIFVDAREGDQPGRVDCRGVASTGDGTLVFSHDVGPSSLVRMARLLYGACPTALVVSIVGADFGYGTALSPVAQAAIPGVIRRIRGLLADGAFAVTTPAVVESSHRSAGGKRHA
jgi:hydrogenase maturation protease